MRAARLAVAIALVVLGIELVVAGGLQLEAATVNTELGPPQNRAETLIWGMDGKAFFQIGVDPTFDRAAEAYGGDARHGAYRAGRPVLGWAAWAASGGGHRSVLGWSLLGLSVAAIGTLVLALGAVARALDLHPRALAAVVATPGLLAALVYPGLCEALALTFAFFGLARWLDGDRTPAVVLFCLAALTRETTLLIPASIGLAHLGTRRSLRGIGVLLIPPAAYLAWAGVVRARVGVAPIGGAQLTAPFAGLAASIPVWGPMEWLSLAAIVAGAVVAWRSGRTLIRTMVAVHLAFFVCLAPNVTDAWWAFGRITLPICLLGILAFERTDAPVPEAAPEPLALHGA